MLIKKLNKLTMIITHLKELLLSTAYVSVLFITLFIIHFHYSDIFTYHFFNGLLGFHKLYAFQVYETIITELYLATLLTVLSIFPIIWLHLICYLVSGLYQYEIVRLNKKYTKLLTIFLFESLIFLFIFLPHVLGRSVLLYWGGITGPLSSPTPLGGRAGFTQEDKPTLHIPPEPSPLRTIAPGELGLDSPNGESNRLEYITKWESDSVGGPYETEPFGITNLWKLDEELTGITQIYSYANVVNLTGRLIILWFILALVLRTMIWQRRYLLYLILIMSIWATPPDIKIQGMLTLTLFLYLEVHMWGRLWKVRRLVGPVGPVGVDGPARKGPTR